MPLDSDIQPWTQILALRLRHMRTDLGVRERLEKISHPLEEAKTKWIQLIVRACMKDIVALRHRHMVTGTDTCCRSQTHGLGHRHCDTM